MAAPHHDKAALRGVPSLVWRAGQERRLRMIRKAATVEGAWVLVDGCGVGSYAVKLRAHTPHVFGLDIDPGYLAQAAQRLDKLTLGAGEHLPYPEDAFDVILSNEVIEHVQDDRATVAEMVRVLRPGGRLVLFCPNRWYPVETHGIYWRGQYKFGNIPLVNYLPDPLRRRLAPHVRAYTRRGLLRLFDRLPVRIVSHTRIFGGYDNLIYRFGRLGRLIRAALYALEKSPLNVLGLSHFLIVEKPRG
jgi:SAM-dependent methyltransferase